MKAIKDCEWEIKVFENSYGQWFWSAFPLDEDSGIADIIGGNPSNTRKEAQEDWECFAKINEIKKWKYI